MLSNVKLTFRKMMFSYTTYPPGVQEATLSVGDAPACAGPDRQTYVAAATAASQLGVAATIQEAEQHDHRQVQPSERVDPLVEGSRRFVEIAGPESVHIEMSASGPKKYYDAHRPLTEGDTCAHLQGWKTKGVCLHHPDGMTRVLCYDADTSEDWQHLVEAAQLLPYGDYLLLLEPSPVQAGEHAGGGHLWIIFDGLVNVFWAKQHVLQFAPSLRHSKESWPGPGNHKVRLPGGKYVTPGVAAWCTLTDGEGSTLAPDGLSAARVLLDAQTPAEIVPAYP